MLVIIRSDGFVQEVLLGSDIAAGQHLQYVVEAGCWFGAYPQFVSQYSFVGCTVSPGFDFEDFELATREQLSVLFPHAAAIIEKLTPSP